MNRPKVYAATKAAKEKVAKGYKPCKSKKGCACGSIGAKAKPKGDTPSTSTGV